MNLFLKLETPFTIFRGVALMCSSFHVQKI
uniref:Uncharacterized protein n=1 Tax=Anguilla anguilla TaxID=7936 RepID=A0A0E9RC41_ANGAN